VLWLIQEAVAEDLAVFVCKPDSAMEGLGGESLFPLVTGPFSGMSPVFHIMVVACSGFTQWKQGGQVRCVFYILSNEVYQHELVSNSWVGVEDTQVIIIQDG
jgi:hypothetical protein